MFVQNAVSENAHIACGGVGYNQNQTGKHCLMHDNHKIVIEKEKNNLNFSQIQLY